MDIGKTVFIIGMSVFVCSIIGLNINYYEQQKDRPLEIYIAGKYSGDIKLNTHNAVMAGIAVQSKCNYPIVPHLWGNMTDGLSMHTYEFWMMQDRIALEHSDAVYKISSSHGANDEEAYAKSIGKSVYYSINDIPNRCNFHD